ncbi:MAG: hypothetical protein R2851_27765 [Caldilineaceae bacterium]
MPDPAARKAAYQTVCEQIAEELPHIYLYDRATIDLTRSNVMNYKVNPWFGQAWNSYEWDIE